MKDTSTEEKKPAITSKEWEIIAMLKQDEQQGVVFNRGECQKTCNCVEMAEYENGGEPVKRGYLCRGSKIDWNDLAKTK